MMLDKVKPYTIIFWAVFVGMVLGGLAMLALTINIL